MNVIQSLFSKTIIQQFLLIDPVLEFVGKIRLFYFVRVQKRLNTLNSESSFGVTVEHNMKSLKCFNNKRMDLLIKPISVLEFLHKNSRILVIGPRNEGDLLRLIGHGFKKPNIRGLDLISYSPMIDLGDMHETNYEDSYFDVIIVGWTLAYSKDPEKFSQEMLRVANDGCVIAIGHEYTTMTHEDSKQLIGYSIVEDGFTRINSSQEILKLFEGNIDQIYSNHDAPSKRSHSSEKFIANPSGISVIFTIKK